MRNAFRTIILGACVFAAASLASCSLQYRDIQNSFNAAVAADNLQSIDSLGALTGSDSQQRYEEIVAKLSDDEIQKLDARLQPNAYAIRAVSQWRTGKLTEARQSAQQGLALQNVASSPRDQLVMTIIPALVIDAELVAKFKASGSKVSDATYKATYPADFETAAAILAGASTTAAPGLPESSLYYVHLQRWRILQNWKIVISRIDIEAQPAEQQVAVNAALADAKNRLGGVELGQAITDEKNSVPADNPLRKVMDALANGHVN